MDKRMGTWGPGIFSDDEAADARADWREAVMNGADLEAATDRIPRHHRAARPGPDQDPDAANVWIALAVAQFETGRLRDWVRDRARDFLANGGDLARWDEHTGARARVLDRWARKLRGPQPAPKRVLPKRSYGVRFDRGDVVRLRDPDSGAEGLVYVAALTANSTPQVEVLAWEGGDVPDADAIAALPGVPDASVPVAMRRPLVLTARRDQAFGPHLGELVARGVERPPLPKEARGTAATWPTLASTLGEPAYQESLGLALDPERLAAVQHEYQRRAALQAIGFLDWWLAEHEDGTPIFGPHNIVNFVAFARESLFEFLTEDEIPAFERNVERARRLGIEIR